MKCWLRVISNFGLDFYDKKIACQLGDFEFIGYWVRRCSIKSFDDASQRVERGLKLGLYQYSTTDTAIVVPYCDINAIVLRVMRDVV